MSGSRRERKTGVSKQQRLGKKRRRGERGSEGAVEIPSPFLYTYTLEGKEKPRHSENAFPARGGERKKGDDASLRLYLNLKTGRGKKKKARSKRAVREKKRKKSRSFVTPRRRRKGSWKPAGIHREGKGGEKKRGTCQSADSSERRGVHEAPSVRGGKKEGDRGISASHPDAEKGEMNVPKRGHWRGREKKRPTRSGFPSSSRTSAEEKKRKKKAPSGLGKNNHCVGPKGGRGKKKKKSKGQAQEPSPSRLRVRHCDQKKRKSSHLPHSSPYGAKTKGEREKSHDVKGLSYGSQGRKKGKSALTPRLFLDLEKEKNRTRRYPKNAARPPKKEKKKKNAPPLLFLRSSMPEGKEKKKDR